MPKLEVDRGNVRVVVYMDMRVATGEWDWDINSMRKAVEDWLDGKEPLMDDQNRCSRCGREECPGAPRFKGICDFKNSTTMRKEDWLGGTKGATE